MPRYRDVVKRTWDYNPGSYRRQLALNLLISLVLGGGFTWWQLRNDTLTSAAVGLLALNTVPCFVTLLSSTVRDFYKELALRSCEAISEVTGTHVPKGEAPNWQSIALCWKLLHDSGEIREVFCGISQELEESPRLKHWRTATFLARS